MSAELDALIGALKILGPEQKARVAQGIWNDADYHVAFSKLLLSDIQSLHTGSERQIQSQPPPPIETATGKLPTPPPKVAPVSAHSVIDLCPEFDGLTPKGKGQAARRAYLKQEGIEKYSTHPKSKQWIRHSPGNIWKCVLYSAEETAKANYWFFGTSEPILRDKLNGESMCAIVFLCRISPREAAIRELGKNRLVDIVSALPTAKKQKQIKFNVRKESDGYYYLMHKRGRERLT